MKSSMPGPSTLRVEVTNISGHGFWILLDEKEYFLSFTDFPWFKKASIDEICDLHALTDEHLFWKKLDVDLELSSIIDPEKYPLVYK